MGRAQRGELRMKPMIAALLIAASAGARADLLLT
jgi:hypothetical protein